MDMCASIPWSNTVCIVAFLAMMAWAVHCITRQAPYDPDDED